MFKITIVCTLLTFFMVCAIGVDLPQERRPKIMGERLPYKLINPLRKKVQMNIVKFHNAFRLRVRPRASNMLRMTWNHEAARAAQNWANKCVFLTHDNVTSRHVDNYGACGQNIFVASQRVPWFFAIQSWFLEKEYFTYGSDQNELKLIGHFTQLVWAASHAVGCGLHRCNSKTKLGKQYFNYVCNYCPSGNRPGQLGQPYRKGIPCGSCKNQCFAKALCTNSCKAADMWANCRDLYKVWPTWLCNTTTPKGRERMKHCMATCGCQNKIHD